MRRGWSAVLAGALALAGCAGDDPGAAGERTTTTTTSVPSATTTTTEAVPVDTTFLTEDIDALCDELAGLAEIDPEADPTQPDVDRLEDIASRAPVGVADRLRAVAAFGQSVVDGAASAELQAAAVDAVIVLIAYGNEACGIDVPLFDAIAGV
jgi:hypothetical protein